MLVLKIIGLLLIGYIVFLLVVKINEYSLTKYRYQFFNMTNFLTSAVGYGLMYFGNRWYISAIEKHGDVLNGQILIVLGVIIILTVFYMNVKNTTPSVGIFLSIIQAIIYSVLSVIAFFVLFVTMAFFANTKPVYNINND